MLSLSVLVSGCSPAGSSAGGAYKIPSDGIVKAAMLQKVKDSGKIAVFNGKSNNISYKWTFVGPDITDPKDVNLEVEFTSGDEGLIRNEASGQDVFIIVPRFTGEIPGTPTLTVSMGKQWGSGICYLYAFEAQNKKTDFVKEIRVVDGSSSAFVPKEIDGCYFLVSGKLSDGSANGSLAEGSSYSTSASSSSASSSAAESKSSSAEAPSPSKSSSASSSSDSGKSGTPPAAVNPGKSNSSSSSGKSGSNPYDKDRDPEYSAGHPDPVDNGKKDASKAAGTVTISIRCSTAVKNWTNLKENKKDNKVVPADGVIFPKTAVKIYKGETVYDLLVYVCKHYRIQMEHKGYAIYGSEYVQGINNLYEFDCGQLSGWMYAVNGWYPNYGISRYQLKNGDKAEWNYTCDLGRDLGQKWINGN